MITFLMVVACGGKGVDTAVVGADSASADTSSTVTDTAALESELYGERPGAPVALPDFVATNRDGTVRGPADVRGRPTVMWFYPAAGTYG
jgi:hypothetical protein